MKKIVYITLFTAIVSACAQSHIEKKQDTIIFQLIPIYNEDSSQNELPIFLIYGELAPREYLDVRDSSIAKKFGFRVIRVAGCVITSELIDSVLKNNNKNNLIMQKKYGKNWIENFEKKTNLKTSVILFEEDKVLQK